MPDRPDAIRFPASYVRREALAAPAAICAIGTHLAAVTEMLSPAEYDLRGVLEVVYRERLRQVADELEEVQFIGNDLDRRQ